MGALLNCRLGQTDQQHLRHRRWRYVDFHLDRQGIDSQQAQSMQFCEHDRPLESKKHEKAAFV